jgi:hypothetical protein
MIDASVKYRKYTNDEISSLNTKKWLISEVSIIFHNYFRYQGTVKFTGKPLF